MRNKKINDMLNLIDDEYISEANPNVPKKKSFVKRYIWQNIAACLVIVLLATNILTLIPLFSRNEPNVDIENGDLLPPDDGEIDDEDSKPDENDPELPPSSLPAWPPASGGNQPESEDSEENENLSDLILNPLPSEYDKLVEKLEGVEDRLPIFKDEANGEIEDSMGDLSDALDKSESYVEVTDNQVNGVIEADLFKRTESHIFYIQGASLVIYSIDGHSSEAVGRISILDEIKRISKKVNKPDVLDKIEILEEKVSYIEMVLSTDGKTVTVISNANELNYFSGVVITTIDVSNPQKPFIKGSRAVLGEYVTTRFINNQLIVITDYQAFKDSKGLKYGYVPMVYTNGSFSHIDIDRIYVPKEIKSANYTVITMLDQKEGKIKDIYAYLDIGNIAYVTNDTIYMPKSYEVKDISLSISKTVTDLTLISFNENGFTHRGKVTFDGEIKNQYSIDVYNGILRVVTTLRENTIYEYNEEIFVDRLTEERTNAALFCYDLTTLNKVCEIRNFAPDGEEVQSVRFDKNYVYVCTAIVIKMTDPVFFIDLTDMNSPKISETGVIDGYSSSLVSLGDGYLLGIGYGKKSSILKIEIYKEENGEVISVCKYEKENTRFSQDYKAYFIDRENGLIGLGITQGGEQKYLLLKFSKSTEEIGLVFNSSINGSYNLKRATLIDGYLYILAPSGLYVREVTLK